MLFKFSLEILRASKIKIIIDTDDSNIMNFQLSIELFKAYANIIKMYFSAQKMILKSYELFASLCSMWRAYAYKLQSVKVPITRFIFDMFLLSCRIKNRVIKITPAILSPKVQ